MYQLDGQCIMYHTFIRHFSFRNIVPETTEGIWLCCCQATVGRL